MMLDFAVDLGVDAFFSSMSVQLDEERHAKRVEERGGFTWMRLTP